MAFSQGRARARERGAPSPVVTHRHTPRVTGRVTAKGTEGRPHKGACRFFPTPRGGVRASAKHPALSPKLALRPPTEKVAKRLAQWAEVS